MPCASPPPIRRMEMGNHLSRRSPKQSQDLGQELSPFGGEAGRVRPDAGSSVRGAGWRGPSALAPPRTESRLAGEGMIANLGAQPDLYLAGLHDSESWCAFSLPASDWGEPSLDLARDYVHTHPGHLEAGMAEDPPE